MRCHAAEFVAAIVAARVRIVGPADLFCFEKKFKDGHPSKVNVNLILDQLKIEAEVVSDDNCYNLYIKLPF